MDFVLQDRRKRFLDLFSEKHPHISYDLDDVGIQPYKPNKSIQINSDKNMAIVWHPKNLEKVRAPEAMFHEFHHWFRGENYLLVQHKGKTLAFDMEKIHLAERFIRIYKDLTGFHDYVDLYWVCDYALMLSFYLIRIVITKEPVENALVSESKTFSNKLIEATRFFEFNLMNKIPWDRISHKQFERLVMELLMKESNIRNIRLHGSNQDNKRDIVFDEVYTALSKEKVIKGVVECKHHKKNVSINHIKDTVKLHDVHKADKYLFVTSAHFTNQAKEVLKQWDASTHRPYQVDYWEREDLERRLEKHPSLVVKYFSNSSYKEGDNENVLFDECDVE